MTIQKLKNYLDDNGIPYLTISHSPAYTARETAASTLVPRREFAKVVMVKLDGRNAMAVIPSNRHVDLHRLATLSGAEHVEMAAEGEFKQLFPDCDIGAMPPFGNLYDMPVFADSMLSEDDDISFNAGSHTQVIRMAYDDYERLVEPVVGEFATRE
jgi:Ala-tRNA(Pro) deacylase